MSITFTIVNQPAAVPGQELNHTFSEGGTLGRTRTCDWVLIDASRFISGKHAVISEQNGVYQITDTSTNGVFINNAATPLGKGNSAILNNGDTLKIGEYVIKVTVDGAQPAAGAPAPFEQPAYAPPDLFETPSHEKIVDTGLDEKPVDILDLFSKPQKAEIEKPIPEPPPDFGFIPPPKKEPEIKGTQGSKAPSIQNHFTPPNVIPDNWLEEEKSAPEMKPEAEFKPEPPPQAPAPKSEIEFAAPTPTPTPMPTPTQPPAPPPAPPPPERKEPFKTPEEASPFKSAEQQPLPATAGPVDYPAVKALLTGLGLGDINIPPDQIPAFMQTVGEVLRESITGAFNVLRSRTNIKSEFRMSMTTIQAVENNPLKFSINVQEAIRNMFLSTSDSYLPPVEAIREGFEDIEGHQLAVMAGTQAAIAALMKRFQPEFLEDTFDRSIGRTGILPGGKKAKYWDAYEDYYKNLAASIEDNFQNMFGEEFARAYENQVQRLLGSRRKK